MFKVIIQNSGKTNNSIPDEILDFMKNAAIEKIEQIEKNQTQEHKINFLISSGNWEKEGSHWKSFKYGLRFLNEAYEIEERRKI